MPPTPSMNTLETPVLWSEWLLSQMFQSSQVEENAKNLHKVAHRIQPTGAELMWTLTMISLDFMAHVSPQPFALYLFIVITAPSLQLLFSRKNRADKHLVNQVLLTELRQVSYHHLPVWDSAMDQHSKPFPFQHPYSTESSLRGLPLPLIIIKGWNIRFPKKVPKWHY